MGTRKASAAKAQAAETPEPKGQPQCYRARVYHEIDVGNGVLRVEPGMIVSHEKDGIVVYPPEVWGDAPAPDQE